MQLFLIKKRGNFLEENCEQPDGRYRYVQKNLDEGRGTHERSYAEAHQRFEKYGQRGQGISHVAIRHFQCVCFMFNGTPYWIYQRLCRGLFKVVAFNRRNQPEMKNWQDNRR